MMKEYVVYRDTLIEALNHLDDFKTKMDNFVTKNSQFTYEETLTEKGGTWEIKVKVNKNEQTNVETT